MDDLHRDADKVMKDASHLATALKADDLALALSIAKRVRRTTTLLVRQIAAERDHRDSPQEGTRT